MKISLEYIIIELKIQQDNDKTDCSIFPYFQKVLLHYKYYASFTINLAFLGFTKL